VFVADAPIQARKLEGNHSAIGCRAAGRERYRRQTFGAVRAQRDFELKLFALDGKKLADIPLPAIGSVFSASGRYDRNEIFFGFQSFTVPPSIYRVDWRREKRALGQGGRALHRSFRL
jgi:hypothetical protein